MNHCICALIEKGTFYFLCWSYLAISILNNCAKFLQGFIMGSWLSHAKVMFSPLKYEMFNDLFENSGLSLFGPSMHLQLWTAGLLFFTSTIIKKQFMSELKYFLWFKNKSCHWIKVRHLIFTIAKQYYCYNVFLVKKRVLIKHFFAAIQKALFLWKKR